MLILNVVGAIGSFRCLLFSVSGWNSCLLPVFHIWPLDLHIRAKNITQCFWTRRRRLGGCLFIVVASRHV